MKITYNYCLLLLCFLLVCFCEKVLCSHLFLCEKYHLSVSFPPSPRPLPSHVLLCFLMGLLLQPAHLPPWLYSCSFPSPASHCQGWILKMQFLFCETLINIISLHLPEDEVFTFLTKA